MISLVETPRKPSTATLLSDLGNGADYKLPVGKRSKAWDVESYIKVPPELWTEGWMARLSSSALAMLLICITELQGQGDSEIYFDTDEFANRYQLSDALRRKGLRELERLGLIKHRVGVAQANVFVTRRRRAIYTVLTPALKTQSDA